MAVIASQLIGKVAIEGADKAKGDLKEVGEHAKETESSFKKLREQVARGFEFGTGMQLAQIPGSIFDAAKEQVVDIIKLAMDHQQILAQTNQVLKSTHDVSRMTAEELDNLAQKFGKVTQFSADTVQSGENLLLTFTNIGKSVFPQATQAILDVSQAMGQDLKESAIQVGKALGDPLTGMTALQRIGVTFSAQEKETIKTMMAHNNIIGAQKVILKELATEFGGSAQAAGKTFAGALKIAQDRVEEIKIKIGTALMPILNEFLQYFEQHMLPRLDDFSNWFQRYGIPRLQDFGKWFQTDGIPDLQSFANIIGTAVSDLQDFTQWLQQATPPAQALRDAAIALGIAIATVKIGFVVNDMKNFIGSVPEMLSKMFLVQNAAEGVAGAKGISAIGTAAKDAAAESRTWFADLASSITGTESKVATAADGMKLSFAGILGAVGGVAGLEIMLAKWIRDNNIVPTVAAANGGVDNNPDWITHVNRAKITADAIKHAADMQKYWNDQITIAWQDMANLTDKYQQNGRILGTLSGITDDFSTHLSKADEHAVYLKSDLDKVDTHYQPHVITTDIEKAMNEARITRLRLDDLASPVSIQVGTRSVDAAIEKVMYAKSKLDDLGGPTGAGYIPGHASGITNSPYGHWAMVGERGPEPMYVPRGASILPSGTMPSGGQGGGTLHATFVFDGVQFARVIAPYTTDHMRYNVGSVGW